MWYQFFKYVFVVPYGRLVIRPKVVGRDNVPRQGPVILASNHQEALDSVLLPGSMHRTVVFPAKAELFTGDRGLKSKLVAWFMKAIKQVPMDRAGGRASAVGLEPVLEVLRDGGVVGIYPEGTRSPDGRLYRGRTGVARIALASGAPVVPVAMSGTKLVRNRLGLPVLEDPRVEFGRPIHLDAPAGETPSTGELRRATDAVMSAIQELSGQEYVDVYASRVKKGELKGDALGSMVRERPGSDAVQGA